MAFTKLTEDEILGGLTALLTEQDLPAKQTSSLRVTIDAIGRRIATTTLVAHAELCEDGRWLSIGLYRGENHRVSLRFIVRNGQLGLSDLVTLYRIPDGRGEAPL